MTTGAFWTITASLASVVVHPGESAVVRFTVTDNATTPAQRRGTLAVLPGPGTDASWFTIDQDTRTFTPGGSADFGVTVRPSTGAASGDYRFSCLVFDPEHPTVDTTVQSDPVTVTVPPAVPPNARPVVLPALGESVTEATVTRWLKSVGETVEVDEPLVEVSTDKIDAEIPSPFAGTLLEILVGEDESVKVGAKLAVIGGL